MTLAELFLLLLLVGWYGSRLESAEQQREPESLADELARRLAETKVQLDQARKDNEALQATNTELKRALEWLGERLGGPISDPKSAEAAILRYASTVKRGKAACQNRNVLVSVRSDDEVVNVTFREPFTFEGKSFEAGSVLTTGEGIGTFLSSVQKFYKERRQAGEECVFDFSLEWRTDKDYRVTRQRFEHYFYPAGERALR